MRKKKILVVDDEQDLCEILLYNLTSAGHLAEAAYSAEEALEAIRHAGKYDLILLDVMMPGMSGFEMAKLLKTDVLTAQMPIIFLTARCTEDDTLQGFNLGADDYIAKPFSTREVVARVNAVLKRCAPQKCIFRHKTLEIDTMTKTAAIDGVEVTLTHTEFNLLSLLMKHQGQVFTRQQLLAGVWPDNVVVTERTVDVNITRLRKKMGRYASCIATRQGFGYYFEHKKNP